jgi:uncharacterized delta-60 repeat protein
MQPKTILKHVLLFNLAVLLFASSYASAQAGTLDPTFATGGLFQAPTSKSATNAVAIQSDGKIVVAGIGVFNNAFADMLFRLNTDGTLDTSFGSGGVANFLPTGAVDEEGFFGVAIQSDGKIVAAADAINGVQLVRVESNGSLDTSFGTGGFTSLISVEFGNGGLALQANGKILLVAGSINPSLMARYTTSGQLDTSFGSGGLVNLQYGTPSQVAVQSNGKILVTSSGFGKIVFGAPAAQTGSIARYNSNGTIDTTFGAAGMAASVASASALVLQGDGKILVAGAITSKLNAPLTANDIGFGVVRYNANGSIDGSFGTRGVAITDFGATANDSGAFAVAVQSTGDIVAAGAAGVSSSATFTSSSFGLTRYTSAGKIDTTFGTNGIVITAINTGNVVSVINALAIQSDGKIVVAGTSTLDIEFETGYVARYLSQ